VIEAANWNPSEVEVSAMVVEMESKDGCRQRFLNGLQTTCKHCQKAEKPNAFGEENKTKIKIK
jgi:hypothetical protein